MYVCSNLHLYRWYYTICRVFQSFCNNLYLNINFYFVYFDRDAFLAVWRAPKVSGLGEVTLKVIKCATDVQKLIANSQYVFHSFFFFKFENKILTFIVRVSDGANAVSLSMRIEIGTLLIFIVSNFLFSFFFFSLFLFILRATKWINNDWLYVYYF